MSRDEFESMLVTALRELPTRVRLRPEAAAAQLTESPVFAQLISDRGRQDPSPSERGTVGEDAA